MTRSSLVKRASVRHATTRVIRRRWRSAICRSILLPRPKTIVRRSRSSPLHRTCRPPIPPSPSFARTWYGPRSLPITASLAGLRRDLAVARVPYQGERAGPPAPSAARISYEPRTRPSVSVIALPRNQSTVIVRRSQRSGRRRERIRAGTGATRPLRASSAASLTSTAVLFATIRRTTGPGGVRARESRPRASRRCARPCR